MFKLKDYIQIKLWAIMIQAEQMAEVVSHFEIKVSYCFNINKI